MAHIERLMDSGEFSPIKLLQHFSRLKLVRMMKKEQISRVGARASIQSQYGEIIDDNGVNPRHNVRPKDILGAIASRKQM